MTSRAMAGSRLQFGLADASARRSYLQRCAVRVTYSPNRVRGQWAAHGRYIGRESAAGADRNHEVGFSAATDGIDIAKKLNEWQAAGDQRLFKMIISPEFGERLDLRRHTRELLVRMEGDLGTHLEWVAVAHFNTEHPHVHIALRGQTEAGPLRLGRDYIKRGIRSHAEELCTAQLGFRTEFDRLDAERREVDAMHVTSLDRRIAKYAFGSTGDGTFDLASLPVPTSELQQARRVFLAARSRKLVVMDLAEELRAGQWRIKSDFLQHLRLMQVSQDRQKMLALRAPSELSRGSDRGDSRLR
jgi:type IV secretory pathway VirD2 relaxase